MYLLYLTYYKYIIFWTIRLELHVMFSYLIKRGASIGLQVNWGGAVEANFIHFF